MKFLLAGTSGFFLGVFMVIYGAPVHLSFLFLLIAFALLATYLIQQNSIGALGALFFFLAFLGVLRTISFIPEIPDSLLSHLDSEVTLSGVVVENPDIRETHQRVTIETDETRVLAVLPLYPELRYGMNVEVTGVLTRPLPFESEPGRTFPYHLFLLKDRVVLLLEDAHVTIESRTHSLYGALLDLKFLGIDALGVSLPEPHASLAGGLILGGKQGLGKELLEDFIVTGLVHIVVLSGYNVMIVAEFILRLFRRYGTRIASGVGITTILLFVLIAGAGAASIRAGIMASIAVYARATGNTYNALRALIVAAFLMVLISPLSLLYDPGFQLSVIATLGLILGAPLIKEKLSFVPTEFLKEIISATIAAQIAVLPLLLYQNGLFSLVALPANVLVLPFVPLAMLLSFLAGVFGILIPPLAPLLSLPAYVFLTYIIEVTELLAALPLSAVFIPAFPFVFVLLSYALLFYFAFRNRSSTTFQFTLER